LWKVFKERKWIFFLMVFFIIGQIVVTIKRGMLWSPFVNVWMYNGVYQQDTQQVVLIFSGKDTLSMADYSSYQWDKIMLSYDDCVNSGKMVPFYATYVAPITAKIGLPLPQTYFVLPQSDSIQLHHQWIQYVQEITGKPIDSVQLATYYWQNDKMVKR
jgi:hypothetical protein